MFVFVGCFEVAGFFSSKSGTQKAKVNAGDSQPRHSWVSKSLTILLSCLPFRIFLGSFYIQYPVFSVVLSEKNREKFSRKIYSIFLEAETPNTTLMYQLIYILCNVILKYKCVFFCKQAISICLFTSIGIISRRKGNDLTVSCVYRECKFHFRVCFMLKDA